MKSKKQIKQESKAITDVFMESINAITSDYKEKHIEKDMSKPALKAGSFEYFANLFNPANK